MPSGRDVRFGETDRQRFSQWPYPLAEGAFAVAPDSMLCTGRCAGYCSVRGNPESTGCRRPVGKGEAAGAAYADGHGAAGRQGGLTVLLQKQADGRPVQRLELFAHKERLHATVAPSCWRVAQLCPNRRTKRRSFSQAAIARSSSPRSGRAVAEPHSGGHSMWIRSNCAPLLSPARVAVVARS